MSDDRGSLGVNLLIFLAGAAVGAAVVALTTPKTGPELRSDIKELGGRVRERIARLKGEAAEEKQA